jgi:hypothetical protein
MFTLSLLHRNQFLILLAIDNIVGIRTVTLAMQSVGFNNRTIATHKKRKKEKRKKMVYILGFCFIYARIYDQVTQG